MTGRELQLSTDLQQSMASINLAAPVSKTTVKHGNAHTESASVSASAADQPRGSLYRTAPIQPSRRAATVRS